MSRCLFEVRGPSTPGDREPAFKPCTLKRGHGGDCRPEEDPHQSPRALAEEMAATVDAIRKRLPGGPVVLGWRGLHTDIDSLRGLLASLELVLRGISF